MLMEWFLFLFVVAGVECCEKRDCYDMGGRNVCYDFRCDDENLYGCGAGNAVLIAYDVKSCNFR